VGPNLLPVTPRLREALLRSFDSVFTLFQYTVRCQCLAVLCCSIALAFFWHTLRPTLGNRWLDGFGLDGFGLVLARLSFRVMSTLTHPLTAHGYRWLSRRSSL
jgi:hypothetical protein